MHTLSGEDWWGGLACSHFVRLRCTQVLSGGRGNLQEAAQAIKLSHASGESWFSRRERPGSLETEMERGEDSELGSGCRPILFSITSGVE